MTIGKPRSRRVEAQRAAPLRLWVAVRALFLLLACTSVFAQGDATSSRLDEFFQGLQTLQADFRQQLLDGQGRLIEESQGTLAIRRPDRFRWDYVQPHKQVIVADGRRVWLHDVDLEQVTVRPMAQTLAGTPAMLLSGADDLRGSFNIERSETRGKTTVIALAPKRTDTDFKHVLIRFTGTQLESMELSDTLGQSTILEFTNVRRNVAIDAARFLFTPPPGVDVIGSTADSSP